MTDCTRFEDDLKAYADGELSPLRRALVRRHLTRCASCREEIIAMTQISEDLRSSEPEDALPPSLREKILAAPGTGSAGLLANGSASGTEDSSVAERLSLKNRPALPVPVKSRLPAWTFAAVAVVAWFVFYPLFQQVHENARRVAPASALRQVVSVPLAASAPNSVVVDGAGANGAYPVPPASIHFAPQPKQKPLPPFTVHLSDREAGTDTNGAVHVQIINPNSPYRSATAAGNTLQALPDTDLDTQRQVHKEASIGIQVSDPEATGDKLNQMVQDTGGYVAANNLTTGDDGLKSGELIVKVPEPQFETFLAAVAKLGTVVSKNVTGQDITEKTSDAHEAQSVEESDLTQAEARLKALGTHAKWDDTQNAEDLRVQLAQTRARLKLLKRMAALGTVTIDLSQTPKAAAATPVTNGFTGTLKATTHDALQSLVGSAGALLALVIWLLAYAPIWLPLLLLGRYALKEYKKREAV